MARDDDKLSPAERRLVSLWKKMSKGEKKKATPRVRAAAKKAGAKVDKEGSNRMTTTEDRKDQERKLRGE